jgi:RimJ/RimL family protein N-acetyltransferase
MPLTAPDEIVAPLVRLRRLTLEDGALLGAFLAAPDNTRYMTFPIAMRSAEAGKTIVATTVAAYGAPGRAFALAICENGDDVMAGACGASEHDDGCIEIFYLVFPPFRGRGLATAAALALVDHLRIAHPDRALIAFIHPNNLPSIGVMRMLGFRDVGPMTVNEFSGREYRLRE